MDDSVKNASAPDVKRLFWLFGLVYFAQAISQHIGLIYQPVQFYCKEVLGYNLAQTNQYLTILGIPWLIKPLYGLVSDFIPLFGYRRKTWLLSTNALAAGGFLWLTQLSNPASMLTALLLTAFGTAATDVIIDAVMVESGKQTGLSAKFQSLQWVCYCTAAVGSALLGGALCALLAPASSLHVAAGLALVAPLVVATASWWVVKEERSTVNLAQFKATSGSLWQSLTSRVMWGVVAFLALFSFNPNLGDPWYYHQVNTLHFPQGFIGILRSLEAVGKLIGALLFSGYLMNKPIGFQLRASIASGVAATLGYLLLSEPSQHAQVIALVLSVVMGTATMVATLSTVILAARFCPALTEGFTFAALMSVINASMLLSWFAGSQLSTHVFHAYAPLVWISAGSILLSWLPLRWLEAQVELQASPGT